MNLNPSIPKVQSLNTLGEHHSKEHSLKRKYKSYCILGSVFDHVEATQELSNLKQPKQITRTAILNSKSRLRWDLRLSSKAGCITKSLFIQYYRLATSSTSLFELHPEVIVQFPVQSTLKLSMQEGHHWDTLSVCCTPMPTPLNGKNGQLIILLVRQTIQVDLKHLINFHQQHAEWMLN